MDTEYKIPFEFVMDYLNPKKVKIKPMFGCFGLYVNNKIVFFLRERKEKPTYNGVWVATTTEYLASLSKALPSINQHLKLVKDKNSNGTWLFISVQDDKFEDVVIKACGLVTKGDKRIGKVTKGSLATI
ncbi:MAG: hypothetical protein ACYDCN_11500 [Bacteroidia bacterium]